MTEIGYQDGITAFFNWYRKQPGVPQRGPNYDPNDITTWPWPDKMERTMRILKDDHDAGVSPPDPPEPPVTYKKVAPRVAYKDGGSDARFCTVEQPGVIPQTGQPPGHTIDESGATYDDNGLCKNGLRSDGDDKNTLTSAREIDGRPYCSLPTMGDPTKNTGSWEI